MRAFNLHRVLLALAIVCMLCAGIPLIRHATTSSHNGPWIYGLAEARFTLTEYADLECPYCQEYFPRLKRWIDINPEANLRWHHLPLSMHEPAATKNAVLAECIGMRNGNDDFWEAVELIYQQTRSNGAGIAGNLDLSGRSNGRLASAAKQCSAGDIKISERVKAQAQEARSSGIDATPTIVISDNRTGRTIRLSGAADDNALMSAIDWLVSHQNPTPPG